MLPSMPEPSVYMHMVLGFLVFSRIEFSCCRLAYAFFTWLMVVVIFVGFHHSGLICACIVSMSSDRSFGYFVMRCSRFIRYVFELLLLQCHLALFKQ